MDRFSTEVKNSSREKEVDDHENTFIAGAIASIFFHPENASNFFFFFDCHHLSGIKLLVASVVDVLDRIEMYYM
jgi:hypothetical protein